MENSIESEVAQSCPTLCDPMDCSLPGSSIHGILQARALEWGAIAFSRGYSQPRDWTQVSHIAGRHFNLWATREAWKTVWGTLKNKNRVIVWSCNHLEKMKTQIQKDTCISVFLVALLTIAKARKQAKFPLANERKKKGVVYMKRPPNSVSVKIWNR